MLYFDDIDDIDGIDGLDIDDMKALEEFEDVLVDDKEMASMNAIMASEIPAEDSEVEEISDEARFEVASKYVAIEEARLDELYKIEFTKEDNGQMVFVF